MHRWLLVVGMLACIAVGFPANSLLAQEPVPPSKLSDILPDIHWNTEEKGALLIVLPPDIAPQQAGIRQAEPQIPTLRAEGYRLAELESVFQRRTISCGTISVFAPATMAVLNTRLPSHDLYADLDSWSKLYVLMTLLNEQQWRKLGSAEGIGAEDLNKDQRALFFSLLPNPLQIEQARYLMPKFAVHDVVNLKDSQRSDTRLSFQRRLEWYFPDRRDSNKRSSFAVADYTPLPERMIHAETINYAVPPSTIYGATLLHKVRAHQKPGHLDFGSSRLDYQIPLGGVAKVGELVRRVAEGVRLELYCDPRFASLKAYLRGGSARAGDILRAIAWGVTGTYRKVGPAFLLTDDLAGLGTRYAVLSDWLRTGAEQSAQLRNDLRNKMRQFPRHLIGWAQDDPFVPGEALQRRIAEHENRLLSMTYADWGEPEQPLLIIPASELPPAVQKVIPSQQKRFHELQRQVPDDFADRDIQFDRVIPHPTVSANLIIPGIGRLPANLPSNGNLWMLSDFFTIVPPTLDPAKTDGRPKGKKALPADIPRRALILTPDTVTEAKRAVDEAKKRGFRELWLDVAPEKTDLLEVAIVAGKSRGVAVGAVIRVLRARGNTTLPRDYDLRGETSTQTAARYLREPDSHFPPFLDRDKRPVDSDFQWGPNAESLNISANRWGDLVRCDLADAQRAIRERVLKVARLPGLAGLILRDMAAPGYESPFGYPYGRCPESEGMGYVEEMRLAFLRQHGMDPVDIIPNQITYYNRFGRGPDVRLPYFPAETEELAQKWTEFRVRTNQEFVRTLLLALHSDVPRLLLYYHSEPPATQQGGMPQWLVPLDASKDSRDLISPLYEPVQPEPGKFPTMANQIYAFLKDKVKVALATAAYHPTGIQDTASSFLYQMEYAVPTSPNVGWSGLVLDFSEVSLETTLSLLDLLALPEEKPPPSSPLVKP